MADVVKKPVLDSPERKLRITLTSVNVKVLEKITQDFMDRAKTRNLSYYGPIRMPTKTLRITTRKTPCGEGSKTWSRYQLRIHKRVLDLKGRIVTLEEVTGVTIDPLVTVEVTIDDAFRQKMLKSQEGPQEVAATA